LSRLDRVDAEILKLLMENPKLQCKVIARKIGVSDKTVARRIKQMESKGIIIKGYYIKISDDMMQHLLSNPKPKVVGLDIMEWEGITQSLIEIFGTGTIIILRQIGAGIGKKYAEKILESNPEQALEIFSQVFSERGWGKLTFNNLDIENCSGRILITKIPFRTPNTNCIIYGIISGCLEKIFQKKIIVKEVAYGTSYVEITFSPGGK